ncbi:type II toxin-antitoxin system RelE/ParE family toxin [Massilia solisilvae]|uniref:Type II toxin-antitoxin system RelE/ParE family toxin n=1 Tax=Massilia solisilvae TaxID=1811225 RepID=A0ABT2BPJ7_9BURK|nr:type II toxin-antitoxin system RelE/ParE family toxin [Massilia solisilvae]MCS0609975.1 type II toxin-antitoxin system RelE/ParE family toxin [Massilia solisilvae]
MKATFIELPPFQRLRDTYFDDGSFKDLQNELMKNPEAGDVIKGTGGLRKIRYADERRGKGKRGGRRVIYFWKDAEDQFWLFTVYDKDEADDLTADERKALKQRLESEIKARSAEK